MVFAFLQKFQESHTYFPLNRKIRPAPNTLGNNPMPLTDCQYLKNAKQHHIFNPRKNPSARRMFRMVSFGNMTPLCVEKGKMAILFLPGRIGLGIMARRCKKSWQSAVGKGRVNKRIVVVSNIGWG